VKGPYETLQKTGMKGTEENKGGKVINSELKEGMEE